MPRGIGRLPFLSRRGAAADRSPNDAAPIDPEADVDDAPVGPPVLLPAMIYRQVLVDQTEVTPVWARPRSEHRARAGWPIGCDRRASRAGARRACGRAGGDQADASTEEAPAAPANRRRRPRRGALASPPRVAARARPSGRPDRRCAYRQRSSSAPTSNPSRPRTPARTYSSSALIPRSRSGPGSPGRRGPPARRRSP